MEYIKNRIGFVGGAGTYASQYFLNLFISKFKLRFNPQKDSDFPNFVYLNTPFSGLGELGITNFLITEDELDKSIQDLIALNCEYAVVLCNTMHYFFPKLAEKYAKKIKLINLITETFNFIEDKERKHTFVLGSSTTKELSLFNIGNCVLDEEIHKKIDGKANIIIKNNIVGKFGNKKIIKEIFNELNSSFKHENIYLIIGCTELSINNKFFIKYAPANFEIIDPLDIIINNLLNKLDKENAQ